MFFIFSLFCYFVICYEEKVDGKIFSCLFSIGSVERELHISIIERDKLDVNRNLIFN